MKRFFKGFTLAEVLITLTIIGVIARVTLPSLMVNTQAQTTAAGLAKAINTLEVGNQRILAENGSRSLTGASTKITSNNDVLNANAYLDLMNTYFNGSLRTVNGTPTFVTKDGIAFSADNTAGLVEPRSRTRSSKLLDNRIVPQKYHGSFVKLKIDINGVSGPNTLAKDQFIVYIDNFGAVIPYGSAEYSSYALHSYLPLASAYSSKSALDLQVIDNLQANSSGLPSGSSYSLDTAGAVPLGNSSSYPSSPAPNNTSVGIVPGNVSATLSTTPVSASAVGVDAVTPLSSSSSVSGGDVSSLQSVQSISSKDFPAKFASLGEMPVPAPLWVANCNTGSTPATAAKRAACTGSIVDNGFKVVYAQ